MALALAACGGAAEPTAQPPVVEAPAEEVAVEEPTEVPAVEEPTEVPAVEEPTEEPAVEEAAPCAPATDGPLAGVDPSGQTIQWWHNHSGSREEGLAPMIEDFNATNECGITVEALNQGSYNDIRDKVNASIGAGEAPAALVVGYQNDQAFYQLNNGLADLNIFVDDPHWGLTCRRTSRLLPWFL
ncbi:MAG: extracellular solute-binding protein [Chloroflexi bacterium]|nr:extracellular solute-binding protein [Chloroflexota bacterium]